MRKIINIRGTNGVGKSTVPFRLIETDPNATTVFLEPFISKKGKNQKQGIVILPKYNFVLVGHYNYKTGGLDNYNSLQDTIYAIRNAVKLYPDYNILYEGLMASSSIPTYMELMKEFSQMENTETLTLFFLPPIEITLQRVKARSGREDLNTDAIESFWRTNQKAVHRFNSNGLRTMVVDTSLYTRETMLDMFLHILDTQFTK